jgi:hypothetical protein
MREISIQGPHYTAYQQELKIRVQNRFALDSQIAITYPELKIKHQKTENKNKKILEVFGNSRRIRQISYVDDMGS